MKELTDELRGKQNTADMLLSTTINELEERFEYIDKPIIMDKILDILQAYIWVHYKRNKTFPSWPENPTLMFNHKGASAVGKDIFKYVLPTT